jgi:hypothetical protein
MCCFVVWLTVLVGVRLFAGLGGRGLDGGLLGSRQKRCPSVSARQHAPCLVPGCQVACGALSCLLATYVVVNRAFSSRHHARRSVIAPLSTPLLFVRLSVGTRNRGCVVEVLDVVEELGPGCEGFLAFGAFVRIG